MALDCPIKKVKNAHPPSKKCHFVRTFTFPNICLLQVLHRVSVSCQNDNTKEQQGNATVSQTNRMEKMSCTTLADEVACFFLCCEDKEDKHCWI